MHINIEKITFLLQNWLKQMQMLNSKLDLIVHAYFSIDKLKTNINY